MALKDLRREVILAEHVKGILRELMGEGYELQLTKRITLVKDDPLIRHIRKLESMLNIKVIASE